MNELNRFKEVQKYKYDIALKEIKNGKKQTHWMWYIFPQIIGLGESETAIYYSIKNEEEAIQYLNDEELGKRLFEITNILLQLKTSDPKEIFGTIDSIKLKSSMTLFDYIYPEDVFNQVLEKYYNGEKDDLTLDILNRYKKSKVI